MDAQVSYIRLLVGDNQAPYTYTDAQIKASAKITAAQTGPEDLRLSGLLGFVKFPVEP
jgi:hypothetical protein